MLTTQFFFFLEGIFRSILKIRSITPMSRTYDPTCVLEYHSVTIHCHLSILFETLAFFYIKLGHDRFTTTYNLVLYSYILNVFCNYIQVDIIYTDFTKAFYFVHHAILIKFLILSGFGDPLLSWRHSYHQ